MVDPLYHLGPLDVHHGYHDAGVALGVDAPDRTGQGRHLLYLDRKAGVQLNTEGSSREGLEAQEEELVG